MAEYLTIGEAAARLGLEVDTVRRLARDGKIPADRTAGGHRRFLARDVEKYRLERERGAKRAKGSPAPRRRTKAPLPAHLQGTVFDEPPFEETPEVVLPMRREAPRPLMTPRPPSPAVPASTRPDPIGLFTRSMIAMQESSAEETRLSAIWSNGVASIPWDVPAHWRARVTAELERYVTANEFPPRLSLSNAIEIVRAKVKDYLAPWFREQATQKAQKEAQQRCDSLRAHGRSYALLETTGWDWSAQFDARREVDTELKREVEADWRERDVEELVDEILDQWDEEEE